MPGMQINKPPSRSKTYWPIVSSKIFSKWLHSWTKAFYNFHLFYEVFDKYLNAHLNTCGWQTLYQK